MSCGRSRGLRSVTQRSNATLKTAIPASAVRLAAGVADAAPAQRVGERRRERRELDQLALLQLGVRGDDGLALPRELAALLEQRAGGFERGGDGVDRRGGVGAPATALTESSCSVARAAEQHLALVGEVPEERALGQPGALGDLGDGGVLEPTLAVERERGLLEPAPAVRLPTRHAPILAADDSD